jgi:SPOR domain/PilZ domain
MSITFSVAANSQTSDRRSSPRERALYSCMQMEDGNGGIILNISESGLAVQVVRSLTNDALPKMLFRFSQSEVWVKARGRIAWVDESRKKAGIEFVELPYDGRIQIKQWISSIVHPSAAAAGNSPRKEIPPVTLASIAWESACAESDFAPEPTARVVENPAPKPDDSAPIAIPSDAAETRPSVSQNPQFMPVESSVSQSLQLVPDKPSAIGNDQPMAGPPNFLSYGHAAIAHERTNVPSKGRLGFGIFVVALLLVSVFVFLGPHLRNRANSVRGSEIAAPELPSDSSGNPGSPAAVPIAPIDRPGFMLQAGAMKFKANAEVLAESLRENNFPAFVWRRETDHFYWVVVGPYADADSALKVQLQLKKKGFNVIRMPWNPTNPKTSP